MGSRMAQLTRWGVSPDRAPAASALGAPRRPLQLQARPHEDLATLAETALRRLLLAENYDSIANLLHLYDAYNRANKPLTALYKRYAPQLHPKKHTCVGLGFELIRRWRRLEKGFPGFVRATSLVSCEEAVPEVQQYVAAACPSAMPGAEKEHVMVCVQIQIDGRNGVMLADPGYHVPRIITVMADGAYPHTGWFTQMDEPHCRKEYNYTFNQDNPGYVEWQERVTRGGIVKCQTSLVFVGKPYQDAVNVTERRNLVYNFRSLLSRDQKGHLRAGMYFPIGGRGVEEQFTLFFEEGPEKRKTKYKFSSFISTKDIPESALEDIKLCNAQLNYKPDELLEIICKLANVMADESFIEQMLKINDDICRAGFDAQRD